MAITEVGREEGVIIPEVMVEEQVTSELFQIPLAVALLWREEVVGLALTAMVPQVTDRKPLEQL